MRRRHLLASLGGLAGGALLGGCLGRQDAPSPSPGTGATDAGDPPDTTTDVGGRSGTPTGTSFRVLGRSCGGGRNAASVTVADGTVSVQGVIAGRDTCDTARLASSETSGGQLEVVVAVVEAATDEPAGCAQCLTDIEYAFEAAFPADGPSRIRVVHRTADGESTVATADWS